MAITKTAKRKVAKRKATTRKKMAAKRRASSKRRALQRMNLVLSPSRRKRIFGQKLDTHPTRKHRIEKIPEGTSYQIKFKIDSGDMKKDSSVLGQIMNDVDLICVPLKIKYEFNVSNGCLFVILGLIVSHPITMGLATIAIGGLIKKINSRKNTKTTYVDEDLKRQLVIATLANRGHVGYIIDDTEELNTGTLFHITLPAGETKKIFVNEQGKIDWIN